MNEIKHIHLGRQSFTISVEAYKELHEYLDAIKAQVGKRAADVVEEIEMRMAELLIEHGVDGEKVVLPADIQFLKEQLGEPHDFKDEDDDTEESEGEKPAAEAGPKRFFRDGDNAMIAGVAAGLAAFFGIDVVIMRLIFVLLALFGGGGVLIYLILWLVVPEARTSSERLQMRGKAVTVDSLKEVVDRANIPAAAERVSKAGQKIGHGVGRRISKIVTVFFQVVLAVIGSAMVAFGAALFAATTVSAVYLLAHGGTMANEVVFPIGAKAVVALLCAVVVVYIGAFLAVVAGLAIVRRKKIIHGWIVGVMCTVFLVAAGAGTALMFDVVPPIRDKYQSLQHTQVLTVAPFSSVRFEGERLNYEFVPDNKYEVEIKYFGKESAQTLSVDGIGLQVTDNVLTITRNVHTPPAENCRIFCLHEDEFMITVHAPKLNSIDFNGSTSDLTQFDGSGYGENYR